MGREAVREAGFSVRRVQRGELLSLPLSRPMPEIGAHVHELRIPDINTEWRIIYRIDTDAVIIIHAFDKKTGKTPETVKQLCRKRLRHYDQTSEGLT
jgi:phage-related protein